MLQFFSQLAIAYHEQIHIRKDLGYLHECLEEGGLILDRMEASDVNDVSPRKVQVRRKIGSRMKPLDIDAVLDDFNLMATKAVLARQAIGAECRNGIDGVGQMLEQEPIGGAA